jgi:hypothetical protein
MPLWAVETAAARQGHRLLGVALYHAPDCVRLIFFGAGAAR